MKNKRLLSLAVFLLLMGCATLHPPEQKYVDPRIGHWASHKENAPVRHWHFRADGIFESTSISYHSVGGNKIFDVKRGAYVFSGKRYYLAYIRKIWDEPPAVRKKRQPTVDIHFVGPMTFIEKGTYELKDGYLTLINDKGVKTTLYRSGNSHGAH